MSERFDRARAVIPGGVSSPVRSFAAVDGEPFFVTRAVGATIADTDGRTYTAASVENPDPALSTSALRGAVSAAVSSGARTFEAAVVVTEGLPSEADVAVLGAFGVGVPVLLAWPDGAVRERLST